MSENLEDRVAELAAAGPDDHPRLADRAAGSRRRARGVPAPVLIVVLLAAIAAGVVALSRPRGSTSAPVPLGTVATPDCPPRLPDRSPLLSGSEPAGAFVAAGVSIISICSYVELPSRLDHRRLVSDAAGVGELVALLNGLSPAPRVALPCPADDGSAYLLVLAGPSGQQVITVHRSGCRFARDETHLRWVSDELLVRLA